MKTLHVRNIPNDLYRRLQDIAKVRNQSLNEQVITMLAQAVKDEELRQKPRKVLTSIRRRRFSPLAKTPSSIDLLHEDRNR